MDPSRHLTPSIFDHQPAPFAGAQLWKGGE